MDNNRYKNGQIYKIVDVGYNMCYIGSTCEELSQRMARHRKEYRNYLNGGKYYITSFEIFNQYGIDNCKIERIEKCVCNDKEELRKREGYYIKTMDCVNKQTAGQTNEEYRNRHHDTLCNKKMEHYWKNRDEINEKAKMKYTCECGAIVRIAGKAEHEKMKKHQRFLGNISVEDEEKERAKKKKEAYNRRLEKCKIKYTCVCGSILRQGDKSAHEKSKKHQQWIEENTNIY